VDKAWERKKPEATLREMLDAKRGDREAFLLGEARIAYKYLTWSWQMDEEARDGLTRQQFARYYLMRLGIGHDLTRIALNSKYPCQLASEAELLAIRPELNPIE